MTKILSIFGTRPEAIKMAPIIHQLQQRAGTSHLQSIVCVTAQHRQMLDQVLRLFDIKPDYDLNVMGHNQSPTQVAAAVLAGLEPILKSEKPDWVLVQGDTTTVTAAAMAAFYAGVQVGHVEAGLRTGDKRQPFPEEINRRMAGVLADRHFAPTQRARQNLLREGIPDSNIVVTGNPVIDALQQIIQRPPAEEIRQLLASLSPASHPRRIILITAHRRENFGQPLVNICQALRDIATAYPDVQIVYPVHLNPNVQQTVSQHLVRIPNITLLPPLEYLSLIHLLQHSYLVLTDSGGLQEEAPSLGKPVLVLREVTERVEAIIAGTVRLVGTNRERIVAETRRLLEDPQAYQAMAQATNPYGDGRAAQRIVASLLGEPIRPWQ